ncbi:hypothetical protein ACFX19_009251 [Malus domestica]
MQPLDRVLLWALWYTCSDNYLPRLAKCFYRLQCSYVKAVFNFATGWYNHVPSYNDPRQRKEITEELFHYRRLTHTQLWDKYSAYEHWAKIEVPKDKDELAALQDRLRKRFPVDAYNKARRDLDPNRILSNNKLEKLFPLSDTV